MRELDAFAAEIERRVVSSDDAGEGLLGRVEASPDPAAVLDRLSRSRRPDARVWSGWAAAHIRPPVINVLYRLARDRDPHVRDSAIDDLLNTGADFESVLPSIRKGLNSRDYQSPVHALWLLARARDEESLGLIERYRARTDLDEWQRRVADVVTDVIRGDSRRIAAAIRDHDHNSMRWLAAGASMIWDSLAQAAISQCVAEAPDESCRRMCAHALSMHSEGEAQSSTIGLPIEARQGGGSTLD